MSGNTPLRFLGVGNMLDREYRNTPAYQWARELVRNGIEAEATTIQIGVEWQGAARGVYRLQYADDGHGMDKEHLRDYMRTLGKGSKIVGGPHDNYALGCRMTLLPWNTEGVVVISMVDGVAYMVKMKYDAEASEGQGEYVLAEEEWADPVTGEEGRSLVYPPYLDEDLEINWLESIPDFITERGHGTTFILLGRSANDDTFEGDVERGESARVLTRKYFNTRFWNLPGGVTLRCLEFINPNDRAAWPKAPSDRSAYQYRTVKGAQEVVEYIKRGGEGTVEANDTLVLNDGTKAHWWLRQEGVDTGGVGSSSGFIAVRYRDELYAHAYANQEDGDTRIGANVYRQFGIGTEAVRRRVFIILEPPEYDEATETEGVAPSTGRADLYWIRTGGTARSVKPSDWADEFADKMPDAIDDALSAAREDTRLSSEERQERLKRVMERFSKRWRAPRARVTDKDADTTTKPTGAGTVARQSPDTPVTTPKKRKGKRRIVVGRSGDATIGHIGTGVQPAKSTTVTLGYPEHEWVSASDIDEPGMMAAWQPPSKSYPNGCVFLDKEHPVIVGQVQYWQGQYPRGVSKQVEEIVMDAYADVAIAKVSHMFALEADTVISEEQKDTMLLNPALSTALLGLIGEDALISPRMGALGTKRKRDEEGADSTPAA